eukprot:360277-Chlamydomonas_euryale.AAC.3
MSTAASWLVRLRTPSLVPPGCKNRCTIGGPSNSSHVRRRRSTSSRSSADVTAGRGDPGGSRPFAVAAAAAAAAAVGSCGGSCSVPPAASAAHARATAVASTMSSCTTPFESPAHTRVPSWSHTSALTWCGATTGAPLPPQAATLSATMCCPLARSKIRT